MEMRPSYPISTLRLRLRPLGLEDTQELLAYRGRDDVCRYLPFEPMDEQVLAARLAGDLGRREITAEGQALTLGAELAASGRLLGDVTLFFRSARHAGGEIGYAFHPDIAGQGYATEACTALLNLAFDRFGGLGLHRVVARMDARNLASARLASRLGMREEAHHRSSEMFKGEWADVVVYALLDHEWHAL
jgi:RimJ/RimL family protein N-acetyltransferase